MLNEATFIVDDALTVSAVARRLELAENTVRSLERRGLLVPFARLHNRTRLYRSEDVERVRAARAAEATR